jgi:hypothetical protein
MNHNYYCFSGDFSNVLIMVMIIIIITLIFANLCYPNIYVLSVYVGRLKIEPRDVKKEQYV